MEESIHFDSIVVIQSLSDGEPPTGKRLFDRDITPGAARHKGFETKFFDVKNGDELEKTLREVNDWCVQGSHSPIVHFEAHGAGTGLTMADGSFVQWEKLRPGLTAINETSGLNLLVIMGACFGIGLIKILSPTQRAPAWGVLGPSRKRLPRSIVEDFSEFYMRLLTRFDLREAVNVLNGSEDPKEWEYTLIPASVMFVQVYQQYRSDNGSIQAKQKRILDLLNRAENEGLDMEMDQHFAQHAERALDDHEFWFEKFKSNFFFHDKFPDNKARFIVNFSDFSD